MIERKIVMLIRRPNKKKELVVYNGQDWANYYNYSYIFFTAYKNVKPKREN